MLLIASEVDLTQQRKEPVNLKMYLYLQKLSNWKHKEEKEAGGGEGQNRAPRSHIRKHQVV